VEYWFLKELKIYHSEPGTCVCGGGGGGGAGGVRGGGNACNPSSSGGRNQEDRGLKPA
jgi:hypothetical protein